MGASTMSDTTAAARPKPGTVAAFKARQEAYALTREMPEAVSTARDLTQSGMGKAAASTLGPARGRRGGAGPWSRAAPAGRADTTRPSCGDPGPGRHSQARRRDRPGPRGRSQGCRPARRYTAPERADPRGRG